MTRKFILIIGVVMVIMALVGCDFLEDSVDNTTEPTALVTQQPTPQPTTVPQGDSKDDNATPAETAAPAVANGFIFPYTFTATDLYGNTVTEQSWGEKELFFVHYWATWCGPCVGEMPELAKIANIYDDRVGFIALLDDYSSAKASVIQITEGAAIPSTFIMVDANTKELRTLLQMADSGYVPTTILINRNGNMVGGQIIGALGNEYGRLIENALD